MSTLKATEISRTIGGRQLLEPTGVELRPGCITVVLGPNGAGKSTLLKCLSFIEPANTGTITVDSKTFQFPLSSNVRPPWPQITTVFQGVHLWPHRTVKENILLPQQAQKRVATDPEILAKTLSDFVLVGLANRYPHQLSGGEKLRTALARAVLLAPQFLLLDEPTASLDIQSIRRLTVQLRSIADSGVSILVVSHLLGFARQVADEIIFMNSGRIAERGTVSILDAPNTPEFRTFLSTY